MKAKRNKTYITNTIIFSFSIILILSLLNPKISRLHFSPILDVIAVIISLLLYLTAYIDIKNLNFHNDRKNAIWVLFFFGIIITIFALFIVMHSLFGLIYIDSDANVVYSGNILMISAILPSENFGIKIVYVLGEIFSLILRFLLEIIKKEEK